MGQTCVNIRAVLFLDQAADEEAAHRSWCGALRLMNMLQFLPLAYWLCSVDEDPVPYPSRDALPLAADGGETSRRSAMSVSTSCCGHCTVCAQRPNRSRIRCNVAGDGGRRIGVGLAGSAFGPDV